MDVHSGGNSLFPVGAEKPSKFPINLSNSRQPPPSFALEKAVFSPFIGQISENSSFSANSRFPPLFTVYTVIKLLSSIESGGSGAGGAGGARSTAYDVIDSQIF
jgi:hypothetical protein